MEKIYTHRYEFKILAGKIVVDQWTIVIPFKGNEKAEDAVKASAKFANQYQLSRSRQPLEKLSYVVEYIDTKTCDDLQAITIEKQGYAIIPFDLESGKPQKDLKISD